MMVFFPIYLALLCMPYGGLLLLLMLIIVVIIATDFLAGQPKWSEFKALEDT